MPESDQQTKADVAYVSIDLRPVWWARLFLQPITLKMFVDHVALPDGRETRDGFTVKKGFTGATQLLWSSSEDKGSWNANKRKRADVETAIQYVDSLKDAARLKFLADHSSDLFNPARFVSNSELDAAIAMANENDAQSLLDPDRPLHPTLKGYQHLAIRLLKSGEETRQAHNQRFVDESLQRYESFFNEVESNPLTQRQRDAIVGNEDANLVVAGAGTGKTSTIIARIAFLLRDQIAQASEVLTIAFARKAREELEDRAESRIGDHGTSISTFHALGLQIIGESEGRKPSVSVLASDSHSFSRFITEQIESLALDGDVTTLSFLTEFGSATVNPYAFKNLNEYYEKVRAGDLRGIDGTRLASRQEVRIYNWFFKRRIPVKYEEKYHKVETGTSTHRRYQPDFKLADEVYLEHFAVAPGEEEPKIFAGYLKEADWKRRLHRDNGTQLYETYSSDFCNGRWERKLEDLCEELGYEPDPMSDAEILDHLKEQGRVLQVSKLISQFLTLFKESEGDIIAIRDSLEDRGGDVERNTVFLDFFQNIYGTYQSELKRTESIDFPDMIALAREHVRAGRFESPWTHIIIDEFQDISRGRASLIQAIQEARPHTRIFAVGDDWQSIFRFAGSDVAVMARDFSAFFGCTRRVDLDQTFRYGTSLLGSSSRFISKNPDQLTKDLHAAGPATQPGIRVIQYGVGGEHKDDDLPTTEAEALQAVLSELRTEQRSCEAVDVLLLGRYQRNREVLKEVQIPAGIQVRFMTCHASKGLEADFAIVCDVSQGRMGFPSEIDDDPILDLVLQPNAGFQFAEERRLFYVAMTRAKKKCILLTPAHRASRFVEELEQEQSSKDVEFVPEPASEPVSCPECNGRMIARDGQYGIFWSCHNYPHCSGKRKICPSCKKGTPIAQDDGLFRCSLKRCDFEGRPCPSPSCDGMQTPRRGKYGDFFGCSNYPRCRESASR
ncbi:UvrD-helicase domain-containing protein [bacterium]|nr:UvrD-helicase domain-containing protein [bacterium]